MKTKEQAQVFTCGLPRDHKCDDNGPFLYGGDNVPTVTDVKRAGKGYSWGSASCSKCGRTAMERSPWEEQSEFSIAAQPKPDVGDEDAAHEYYNREDKDCDDDEVAFMEGAKHGRAQERVNTERVERDKASNDRDYLEQAVRLAKAEARLAKLEEALKSIQNRYGDFPYAKDIRKVALEALLEDLKGAGEE